MRYSYTRPLSGLALSNEIVVAGTPVSRGFSIVEISETICSLFHKCLSFLSCSCTLLDIFGYVLYCKGFFWFKMEKGTYSFIPKPTLLAKSLSILVMSFLLSPVEEPPTKISSSHSEHETITLLKANFCIQNAFTVWAYKGCSKLHQK